MMLLNPAIVSVISLCVLCLLKVNVIMAMLAAIFIGGFAGERVLRAPADGAFRSVHRIGDLVKTGDVAGYVSGEPMVCTIDGVLRGLIADGIPVRKGMKSGDVDPRGNVENCYTVSDKATAVGGGVLEAILHLSGALLED